MSTTAETIEPGLTAAEVAQRVADGKVNSMPDRSGRSVADIVRANVFTRINAILGVLFAIVAFTGSLINGLFGLLIIANSTIGIVQEVRAKRTLDKLAIVGQTRPRVRRDGEVAEVSPDEVVLDDIIEIGAGDQIVVDGGEVIEAIALDVDESLLTGEADPIDKDPVRGSSPAVSWSPAAVPTARPRSGGRTPTPRNSPPRRRSSPSSPPNCGRGSTRSCG